MKLTPIATRFINFESHYILSGNKGTWLTIKKKLMGGISFFMQKQKNKKMKLVDGDIYIS